ncbi:hypothetical protein EXN22_20355 [Pseudomonas tructae]|uniref:Oligosaccharide repeat unit polymerase n=1 Tax=Pseudomonas tructae TaxID=2518644 RepID=A0A411MM51_9PSED|nr:hypothetical protein [Pseudomonas tructae]QBF27919.1 hypothetical protein EXN22_20355 [Pseudomonas tructae]
MLSILKFRNVYLLPIVGLILFYIVPSALGVFFGERKLAFELLLLSMMSVMVYYFAYVVFRGRWFTAFYGGVLKVRVGWAFFSWVILGAYFSVIVYAAITAPGIALFEALKGGSLSDISGLREEFLRTREGWERGLLYVYAIGVSSLMPLVISQLFITRSRWRFAVLGAFLFSLALTLEKSRALVAMLPLVVIFVNTGNKKKAYAVMLWLVLLIALVSVIARGAFVSDDGAQEVNPMSGVPDEYNLFVGETSQIYYIINRIWYIPYVTAIDWLRYRETVLNDESTHGKSISAIAWISGEERVNLEQEVFAFQWGQNETGTGSANTVFYVDAYLSFDYLGVLLYSIILAFCVRVCVCSANKALIACLAISVYYVCFNSLSAVLFSGGLGFIFILALFFRIISVENDNRE